MWGRKFGDRFLDPRGFLGYAKKIRLVQTVFHDGLLEFLEQQRLLVPIARIRFPAPIVRSLYVGFRQVGSGLELLETESDSSIVEIAQRFHLDIGRWPGSREAPCWHHVLDVVPPECAVYVDLDPGERPPVSRRERRVQVGSYDTGPLFTSDFQHECYRYWQVLQLAEILAMKVEILTDLRDPDIFAAARDWKLDTVSGGRQLRTIPYQQAKVLDEFSGFRPEWETVAYAYAYSRMARDLRWLVGQVGKNDPATLDARFGDDSARFAVDEAVRRFETTPERLMAFLRWQCERWDYWTDEGRELVADEYRWNISATVETICIQSGKDFEMVAAELGRVTGHTKPTLKVVLPEWVEERREDLIEHFKHRMQTISARYGPAGFTVDVAVVENFASWVESEQLFQIFFHYEILANLNVRTDSVARVGYAKEAVALASTVEHAVNSLVSGHVQVRGMTLRPKLRELWRGVAEVSEMLDTHRRLTRTDTVPFEQQSRAIDRLPGDSGPVAIAKDLLRAVLIRNEGNHLGLAGLPDEAVRETVGVLFEVILVCWLEAARHGAPVSTLGEESA